MDKFSIPQEVQREDRIFGPITMRRLVILCIGGGFTYLLYLWLRPSGIYVWGLPVFIGTLLTLCMAFLEIFGMRFEKLVMRALEYFMTPRQRVWDKRFSSEIFFEYIAYRGVEKPQETKKQNDLEIAWTEKEKKLNELQETKHILH